MNQQDINQNKKKLRSIYEDLELSFFESLTLEDDDKHPDPKEESKTDSNKFDVDNLKKIRDKLKNNNNLLIEHASDDLTKITLREMPAKNQKCPCGSKLRYKKCCEEKDLVEKS